VRPGGAIKGKWRIPDGKGESGLYDIWSCEGGSPRLCRLRTASIEIVFGPPTDYPSRFLRVRRH
jgi:hypothetical protein